MNKDTVTTSTAPISARVKPSFFRASVLRAFGEMTRGHLRLELADGSVHDIGSHADALARHLPLGLSAAAVIRIRREKFFKNTTISPTISSRSSSTLR